MLREIRVRNFAVIDAVTATFGPGLNVLTGETGAGQSMLIDALLLIRGARAQTDVIRTDTETATVEAVFDVEPRGPAAAVLDDAGLSLDEGQLVVRRELTHSGRHRAFVNDSPVSELFAKHQAARAEVEHARAAERDRAQREDLLRFQLSELDGARVWVGEEEELRSERRRLQHAERLAPELPEAGWLPNEDEDS